MIIGVFLLFIKQTMWAGIGIIGIGVVAHFFTKKQPSYNYFEPRVMQKFQQPQQKLGFDWGMRENVNPNQRGPDMPGVDGDAFSLPVPMGDLSNMMEFRHKTRVK